MFANLILCSAFKSISAWHLVAIATQSGNNGLAYMIVSSSRSAKTLILWLQSVQTEKMAVS